MLSLVAAPSASDDRFASCCIDQAVDRDRLQFERTEPITSVVELCIADERLVDGMKTSPHNGSGTPRDDATPGNGEMANYGSTLHYQDGINPVCDRKFQSALRLRGFRWVLHRTTDRVLRLLCANGK